MTDDFELDGDQFTGDDLLDMIRRATNRPHDVEPQKGIDKATVLAFNAAAGTMSEVTEPGTVECDPEGIPDKISEGSTSHASMGSLLITRAALEAVGLTAEEVPNVRVTD